MKLYLIIIVIANFIIAFFNSNTFANFIFSLMSSLISTIAVIAADGITAYLIRRLPENWFSVNNKIFEVQIKERNFYKKIKIKCWKDKIPELGGFTGLHKNRVESTSDSAYLSKFIMESNYGVVIHIVNAVFGYIILLLPITFNITFWVACVNVILTSIPVLVLRYNTPILRALYQKSLKRKPS